MHRRTGESTANFPLNDPLSRIITVGCISCGALGHTSPAYVALSGCVYAAWTWGAGISPAALLSRLKAALLFLTLIVLANALTGSGRVIADADGLYLTSEGLLKGGEQALRLSVVIWGAFLLVSSSGLEEFQDAAERLTTRRGHPLVASGTIALTHLPLIVESARRVAIARRARGEQDRARFPGGIIRAASSALPLLAAAMRNADALAEAMESRCYSVWSPRTRFKRVPVPGREAALVLAVLGLTAASLTGIL